MNQNERYYRKVISSIGVAMLFFLLFLNLFAVGINFFSLLPIENEVAMTVLYQLLYAAGYLLSFMVPVAILKKLISASPYPYRSMYTTVRFSPWAFLAIPAGVALVFSASYVNSAFLEIFHYSEFSSEFLWGTVTETPKAYQIVLEFIVISLVPGFCEEFLFRGAILTNCLPFGRANAILISAFLFALMHQNAEQFFYTFVAGIIWGVMYEMTGSIWPGTIAHAFNNFISLSQGVLSTHFSDPLASEVAVIAFEAAILLCGVICLVVLAVRFFGKRRDLKEGIFGRDLPASEHYATYPVASRRMLRLFWTPSMLAFVIFCALQILLLIGMAVMYGTLG